MNGSARSLPDDQVATETLDSPERKSMVDFFVVGAAKAGTTSLCGFLAEHPGVCFSRPKEPNFFSDLPDDGSVTSEESLKDYLECYSHHMPGQIRGEGSVNYLRSESAARRIKELYPTARIVICLRNPVERARSLFEMYVRHGLELERSKAFSSDSFILGQCLLTRHIATYLDLFGRSSVHALTYERLKENTQLELDRLLDFLELEGVPGAILNHRNLGGVPRHPAARFLANRTLVTYAKRLIPERLHGTIDFRLKKAMFDKIVVSGEERARMQAHFADDIRRTEALLEMDLQSDWF